MTSTPSTPASNYRLDAARNDVWTNEQMALFLMTLGKTGLVSAACAAVEKSEDSAFWLRRSPRGRLFAFGWTAAHLMARDLLEARLLDPPPPEVVTVKTEHGHVTRKRRFDKKIAMYMFNRLEQRAVDLRDGEMAIARSVAGSWEKFIELIARGGDIAALSEFLIAHPDPLATQVEAMRQRDEEAAQTSGAAGAGTRR